MNQSVFLYHREESEDLRFCDVSEHYSRGTYHIFSCRVFGVNCLGPFYSERRPTHYYIKIHQVCSGRMLGNLKPINRDTNPVVEKREHDKYHKDNVKLMEKQDKRPEDE